MTGQLKLGGLDGSQLKEAAVAATIVASLSTWLYGTDYDLTTFEAELARVGAHMMANASSPVANHAAMDAPHG